MHKMKAFDKSTHVPFESTEEDSNDFLAELEELSQESLLVLRQRIDAKLTETKLGDINLERELVLQYTQTKFFLASILEDKTIPANQRAQAINSCSAILQHLIKMQTDLYGAERLKAMEAACIKAMKTMAPEAQEVFLSRYHDYYKNNNVGSDLPIASGEAA